MLNLPNVSTLARPPHIFAAALPRDFTISPAKLTRPFSAIWSKIARMEAISPPILLPDSDSTSTRDPTALPKDARLISASPSWFIASATAVKLLIALFFEVSRLFSVLRTLASALFLFVRAVSASALSIPYFFTASSYAFCASVNSPTASE